MLAFTKDLETGVERIDIQHKELIDRINKLIATGEKPTSKDELKKTIDYLGEYVVKHFGDEERLQAQYKYPKYEEHKEKHKKFVEEYLNLKKEFETNGDSVDFILKLNNSIIVWIVKHIKGDDVELGKFIKAQG